MWLSRLQSAQEKYKEAVTKSERVVGLDDCLRNLSHLGSEDDAWPPTFASASDHQFTRRSAVKPPVSASSSGSTSGASSPPSSPEREQLKTSAATSRTSTRRSGRRTAMMVVVASNGDQLSQKSGSSRSRSLRKIASGLLGLYRSPSPSLLCFKHRRLSRSCSHLNLLYDRTPGPGRGRCHSLQNLVSLEDSVIHRRLH